MDSLTHIVLGACLGEVMLDRKAGRKAMLWGASAQSVPDIDFVAGMWMPLPQELLAHRGLTHSFLFAIIISFFLALVAARWHKAERISLRKWMLFFLIEIFCHLFLDSMNNYGIGWFEPFIDYRISFDVLYVADPLFTLVPLIAFLLLLVLKTGHAKRLQWSKAAIMASSIYLLIALFNKFIINNAVDRQLKQSGKNYSRFFTTPTLLNNVLWFVVAEDSAGFDIGYASVFKPDNPLQLHHVQKNDALLNPIHDHEEVMQLKKFSQGYYTIEQRKDTLVLNDLRFGQIKGWVEPRSPFTFHYFLSHPEDNELIVQRGRFAGLDGASIKVLLSRMFGAE